MTPHSYRRDPLSGRTVIIAPGRQGLTQVPAATAFPPVDGLCPFCEICKGKRPEPLGARYSAEGDSVRVVANRYPALSLDAAPPLDAAAGFELWPAWGAQEVIIESDDHDGDLTTFPLAQVTLVLRAWRDRVAHFEAMDGIAEISVFRNHGRAAGASQTHPHSQVVASGSLGPEPAARAARAAAHHARTGRTLLEDILARELLAAERIVHASPRFVVLCPFAPRERGEAWVVPRQPLGSLSAFDDDALAELAPILVETMRRARAASGRIADNLVLRLAPVAERHHPAAHCSLEILPRGAAPAGFELSSGVPIVTLAPERAAAAMRF